ncbi:MAG TPA: fumarylacetoacetate hydrolase family protein [Burkholderiales bacterium]|nr:fumarylacetoacetate hydrolase family protein [Burkholderiales bacterium]
MRLLSFRPKRGGAPRVGVLLGDGRVLAVGEAARRARQRLPFDAGDMLSLIASGRAGLAALRRLTKGYAGKGLALASLKLLAPIPRPRKNVFCVGWNYLEHFEEGAKARPHLQELPAHPTFFTKAPTAVNGPFDPIPLHAHVTEKLDWEVELGVVIGRGGRDIAEADALKHVYGYTVINDVSAREVQRRHGQQWFKGKSLDGSCPMGPWIVTADEVPDPQALRVTCRLNGVVKQDASTAQMYFRIPRIIAELSAGLTLESGDVISTGTPAGVGHARTPPEFMRAGDVLETEVEGVGTLRNRIGR